MSYREKIDINRLPKHIAIIMDGNGRWAKERNLPRTEGHRAGVKTVRNIVSAAVELGIKYLTLYTFSTENWKRPVQEVKALMQLLLESMDEDIFMNNGVKLRIIGDMNRLPLPVQMSINRLVKKTENNTRATVALAISYSARWEITEAAKRIATQVKNNTLSVDEITEDIVSSNLTTNFMPDPELLIRTGGEYRISNYLLWQISYSELFFTDAYWPDMDQEELCRAIYEYQQRERRFGLTGDQIATETKK